MKLWFINKDKKPGEILSNLQKEAMSKIPKNLSLKIPANLNLKNLTDFLQETIKNFNKPTSGSSASGTPVSRPMKFPYTLSAKIAQFPFKYYFKHSWVCRYAPFGFALWIPPCWYIHRMANSPQNKATWAEIRRKEMEEYHHKFDL